MTASRKTSPISSSIKSPFFTDVNVIALGPLSKTAQRKKQKYTLPKEENITILLVED